ncbi:MAG: aspartate/glutamate racemase family protein [Thaumarchaeota archaeon]|nr:aspartate/glutamate racemase family protein [Nitrososphaerota archaeon]
MGDALLKRRRPNGGRIGIISGSGPEAGIDLWKKMLDANKKQRGKQFHGDLEAPEVSVDSIPELGLSMDLKRNEKSVWNFLEAAARDLAPRTDLFCIACHTLHYFSDDIIKLELPSRYVSMVDSVTRYVRDNEIPKVAILGSRSVMELGKWSPYAALQSLVEIERPTNRIAQTNKLILQIKRLGSDAPSVRRNLQTLISELKSETVLLACTELSMVRVDVSGKHLIDPTLLLANDVVRLSLSMNGQRS